MTYLLAYTSRDEKIELKLVEGQRRRVQNIKILKPLIQ